MNDKLTDRLWPLHGNLCIPVGCKMTYSLFSSSKQLLALTARHLLVLKAAWTPSTSLCGFKAEPLKDCKKARKVMFRILSIPPLRCGNPLLGWGMRCIMSNTPLGKLKVVKVYIPDQLPAMSDLTSTGIPAWWRSMCWNGLPTHRPPDVPASSGVCCSFGAQVPPHLLSSCWHVRGFYLSKDSWCMFKHMALHFRLFWQPNTTQQSP